MEYINEQINETGAVNAEGYISGLSALENITIEGEIANSISFSYSNKLTHDSLMSVINALAIVETTKTLTLHADSKALLTDAEKAIATEKSKEISTVLLLASINITGVNTKRLDAYNTALTMI